jgi:hypothetical protein
MGHNTWVHETVFSSTKLEIRAEQDLPETEEGRGEE